MKNYTFDDCYDYYYDEYEQKELDEIGIESPDFINEENIDIILEKLCIKYQKAFTEEFPIKLVLITKAVNSEAHRERSELLFEIKAKLLEIALKCWGDIFSDKAYGVRKDEIGRYVAYFDVPKYGQLSFHLVNVNWDPRIIPEYTGEWKHK